MELRVEQDCPQCGAPILLTEADQVLTCTYCGSKNALQCNGHCRYVLPMAGRGSSAGLLLAPYVRFKGTIYLVTDTGIEHRVIDTTQAANPVPGLPPSLGLRPQAMQLSRINPDAGNLFLPQTLKASAILEKAAAVGNLAPQGDGTFYHRAYIGEHLSTIYLPLAARDQGVYDGVTDTLLIGPEALAASPLQGRRFDPAWTMEFLATLCPQCGNGLDGEVDCRVMTCANCDTAWALESKGLCGVEWQMHRSTTTADLWLPFWKIATHIPALDIYSFADFVERSNQPFLPKPQWRDRVMSVWIPAFRLRPKVFLQAGRQLTLGQWQLTLETGRYRPALFPVTMLASEARQAVKLMLAAATASPRRVFPHLPQVRLTEVTTQLVFLPFVDKGHDWYQPETGVAIAKNVLRFGRSL